MKTRKASFYFMALIAFSGCATDAPIVLNQPVGPARSHVGRQGIEGGLVVYSAPELVDLADSAHPTHSSYTIYDQDGMILRRVDTHATVVRPQALATRLRNTAVALQSRYQ